jgi:PAS domain S-box-containing protein
MILSEILYRVPCPIFWKDTNGYFLGCNKAFLALSGFSDTMDIVGKCDLELPWRKNSDQYREDDQFVIKTGNTIHREEKILLSDGGYIVSETTKTPLLQNGKIVGVLGVCIDVTAEKETETLRAKNIKNEEKLAAQAVFKDLIDNILSTLHRAQIKLSSNGDMEHKLKNSLNNNIKLSKREQEILYYLSINKSPKEIATIIGKRENKSLSPATVLSIICKQLYVKFDINSTSGLVEKARLLGMVPFILDSFSNPD